jgi:hypothetical protein
MVFGVAQYVNNNETQGKVDGRAEGGRGKF